jgi:hypothetical protein
MTCSVSTCGRRAEWRVVFWANDWHYCSYHALHRGRPRWPQIREFESTR